MPKAKHKRRSILQYENAKTSKGKSLGYITGIMYLAPGNESGLINLCPSASPGCLESCLFTAGRGAFQDIRNARIAKTEYFMRERAAFWFNLVKDIQALIRKCERENMQPCVRLNGTSDIIFEKMVVDEKGNTIFDLFPGVAFYDYSKIAKRFSPGWKLPENYHLTFSRSETNQKDAERIAAAGHNVAVVFSGELPAEYAGRPVHDSDSHDLRFLDPAGVICGLKAKGKARKDSSGFVVPSRKLVFKKVGV